MINLSIIIVNWKSASFTIQCLKSLYESKLPNGTEIIVIDNASFDECKDLIAQRYPAVRFIQNPDNTGFAAANNIAFTASSGSTILLLNPDTEVMRDAVMLLYTALNADPSIGAVGARLLNADLSLQTSCIMPFPTLFNQAFDIEGLKRLTPRWSVWKIAPMYERQPVPADVEALSGACLMVRRDVFEIAGRFSTEYFMYAEDIDLCAKIRHNGYRVCYLDKAEVIHYGGGSTGTDPSFRADILMREATAMMLAKFRGIRYAKRYRTVIAFVALMRIITGMIGMPVFAFAGKADAVRKFITRWQALLNWALVRKVDKAVNYGGA